MKGKNGLKNAIPVLKQQIFNHTIDKLSKNGYRYYCSSCLHHGNVYATHETGKCTNCNEQLTPINIK